MIRMPKVLFYLYWVKCKDIANIIKSSLGGEGGGGHLDHAPQITVISSNSQLHTC